MKGNLRKNYSSNVARAAQICIPVSRMTLQEAAMTGTYFMNIQEGKKPKNIQGKAAVTALNA